MKILSGSIDLAGDSLVFRHGKEYFGLHCGDTLAIFDEKTQSWIDTRVEMNAEGWYFIGVDGPFIGVSAKISV